jgi:hypothetical protein
MRLSYFIIFVQVCLNISVIHDLAFGKVENSGACEAILPDQVRVKLKVEYPGWKILERHNLNTHQLEIWKTNCPGVASGNFKGHGVHNYAVVVIREHMANREARMLLILKNDSGYEIRKLREEKLIPSYPVVHSEPPGVYREFYDRQTTIHIQSDVFIYEHLEVTATLFYYRDGQIRDILISD